VYLLALQKIALQGKGHRGGQQVVSGVAGFSI
jgi:hypothetical protein